MSRVNRVLLADQSQAYRERIKHLLQLDPIFEVAAETDSGKEAISLVDSIKPDLTLVAMELRDMKGTRAVQEMKRTNPGLLIVMQAEIADVEAFFEALKTGAQGYLVKTLHPASLHEYLRSLLVEGAPLSRELGSQILKQIVSENIPPQVQPTLSAVETAVLRYLCRGLKTTRLQID